VVPIKELLLKRFATIAKTDPSLEIAPPPWTALRLLGIKLYFKNVVKDNRFTNITMHRAPNNHADISWNKFLEATKRISNNATETPELLSLALLF